MADSGSNNRKLVIGAVVLLLLLCGAGFAGYQLLDDEDDDGRSGDTTVAGVPGLEPGVPTVVSVEELKDLGAEQGPIYWAGERRGTQLEVTVTTEGGTYVRYLPKDAEIGTTDEYLTIGTYDSLDGYDALAAAKKRDADVEIAESGAVIATFDAAPLSTYFSFPESTFQVEVFSPEEGESREITESGEIGLVTR